MRSLPRVTYPLEPAVVRIAPLLMPLLLMLALPAGGHAADLADSINALRARGCSGGHGTQSRLTHTRALDAVAQEWSNGGRLQTALERTRYRASNSSSMHVSGAADDRAVIAALASSFCNIVTDPAFSEIGIRRRGREAWIVVAKPLELPASKDANAIAREVLMRVNEARAHPRRCGAKPFSAAPPLSLSPVLSKAALIHSQDMARHDHFEHEGTDRSTPSQRVTRAGYRWRSVAENIAAGAADAQSVVAGWLKSPGHCANIMNGDYTEMGVAYTVEPKSKAGIFWTQVFATPADRDGQRAR